MRQFDINKVDSVLLLIQYSAYSAKFLQRTDDNACLCIIKELLKAFEENFLLDSEQALLLWAHVIFVMQQIQPESKELLKLFESPLEKLSKIKIRLLALYQRYYVEAQDKQKLQDLHARNPDLLKIIVEKFVAYWYYNGELQRTKILLESVNCFNDRLSKYAVLGQLHVEMFRWQHLDTFEAFYLYTQLKKNNLPLDYLPIPKEQLRRFKPPACVLLLLSCSPDAKQGGSGKQEPQHTFVHAPIRKSLLL